MRSGKTVLCKGEIVSSGTRIMSAGDDFRFVPGNKIGFPGPVTDETFINTFLLLTSTTPD